MVSTDRLRTFIEFVHDIAFNMQKGIQTDAVVKDFAKAIDKVAHNRLLYKLSAYGLDRFFSLWKTLRKLSSKGNHLRQLQFFQAFHRAQFWALFFFSFI